MNVRTLPLDALVAALAGPRAPVLLDVRELVESERGRIPGAAVLPRRRIEFRIDTLVRDRATPLVTLDGGEDVGDGVRDPRAALAADTLRALGYADVAALDGGVAAWRAAGLALAAGSQGSAQAFGRRVGDLQGVPTIDVDTLHRWQREGRRVALCDVRSPAEHFEGCIPGSVSLPGFDVVSHAVDIAAEADVIVMCSSARTRSMILARTLIDLGLGDVVALDGGTLAWRLAGHPLETGSHRRRVPPSRAARQFAQLGAARLARHVGVGEIEASELAALVDSGRGNVNVFDLRHLGRHGAAHVPRSVSVSSDALVVRSEELVAVRDAPTILVDDDPVRARLVGAWLRRLGLPRVLELAGGFAAWSQGGHAASNAPELPLGWREAQAVAPGLGVEDASRWLALHEPARVLHVDTGASFRRGHLPGAVWLPRGWLEARVASLARTPGDPILLACTDGSQAAYAAATLRQRGHAHVAWLQGGTRQWGAAGRVLETSVSPPAEQELQLPARRGAQGMRDYLAGEAQA